MKVVYPIIFRNKISSIQKVSTLSTDCYNNIIKYVIQEDFIWENIGLYNEYEYLVQMPVDYDVFSKKGDPIKDFLIENIFKNESVYLNNKLTNDNSSIFIDISSLKREPLIFSLFLNLSHLLGKDLNKYRIIVLINDLQTSFDLSLVFLDDFIKTNQLVVFDLLGKFANIGFDKKNGYDHFLRSIKTLNPPLDILIEKKMITKIGHFRRPDSKTKELCFRTYLDGQFCINEIVEYLLSFININLKQKPHCIIYYSKYSPWLEEIIYIISEKISKYGNININSLKEKDSISVLSNLNSNSEIIFITDLLNSGETFQKHCEIINNALSRYNISKIHYLSIMNNKNAFSNSSNKKIRKFVVFGKSIYVNYILDVMVIEKHENDCVLCKLNIPIAQFNEDYRDKLTSFEFWELCHNSNYTIERFVPKQPYRTKIKVFPNTFNWIENNGPFIAYKFKLMLDSNNISINNISLVLPDESDENDTSKSFFNTPSGRFAQCLSLIFDVEYYIIPRKIIDESLNEKQRLEENNNLLWKRQIKETTKDLIIVDEAQVKGGTFYSLVKILSYLHRNPIAYFPLIDFNPEITQRNMKKYNDIKFLNLYEFQI